MTQDEIMEMARQAGGQVTAWVNQSTIQKTTTFTFESPIDYYVSGEYPEKYHIKFLEAFAKLVATEEHMKLYGYVWTKNNHSPMFFWTERGARDVQRDFGGEVVAVYK